MRGPVSALLAAFSLAVGQAAAGAPAERAEAERLVERANERYRQDDLHGAMRGYARAAVLDPSSADAQAGMGLVYADLGYPRRALRRYNRALKLNAASPSLYLSRAWVKRKLGFTERALDDLDRAVRLDSNGARAYAERSRLLASLGRNEESLEELRRAAALDPDYRNRYEELLLEVRGRPAWPWTLAAAGLLAAFLAARAWAVRRRLTGDEGADREALYRAKSGCVWAMTLGWTLAVVPLMLPTPVSRSLGARPLGPGLGLVLYLAVLVGLMCRLELCFAPLQDRLRGVAPSRLRSLKEALRDAFMALAPVLAYNAVLAAILLGVFWAAPPEWIEAVPGRLMVWAAASAGIGLNALLMPELLKWTYRARRAHDGPVWEAVRDACRGALPRMPPVFLVPEPREGRVLLWATTRGRILVSASALELLTPLELAAVIKHEAGHVAHSHVAKGVLVTFAMAWGMIALSERFFALEAVRDSGWGAVLWGAMAPFAVLACLTAYLRMNELAADRFAVSHGADPEALVSGLEKMHRHNSLGRRWTRLDRLFSSHPEMAGRAAVIRALPAFP